LPDSVKPMGNLLEDRVCLVTGAGRGIGKAVSIELAKNGALVVITDLRLREAERVARMITHMNLRATAYRMDVSNKSEVNRVFHEVARKLGGLDVLVNSAEITYSTPFEDIPENKWDRIIQTNLKGTFLCSQAAFRTMRDRGGGSIVNIASSASRSGGMVSPGLYTPYAHFAASKAGIESLTRSIAFEGAPHGIRVNAVSPGPIETDCMEKIHSPHRRDQLLSSIPLGRLGRPEEVAAAVVFLASDKADYVTGKVLDVNGGVLMD
jgi:3-oxoacyl-[acyl-carrier protein] reductase